MIKSFLQTAGHEIIEQKAIWSLQLGAGAVWLISLSEFVKGGAVLITALTGMVTAFVALWLALRKAKEELKKDK